MKHGLWWWIDRWRESTAYRDMNLEQQGAYRNLLEEAWMRGGRIPANEESLAKACGDPRRWKAVRDAVLVHFETTADGHLENATLNEVMRESQRRRDKQAAWRDRRKGPDAGNATGNATGNGDGNEAGNGDGLHPGLDLGSPITNHRSKERTKGGQAVPIRRARGARPARPPGPDPHEGHIPELCGWVCLPFVFLEERLPRAGGAGLDDLVAWAVATRAAFGDTPVDDRRPFEFWRARWSEATADVTPTPAEREQWALYTRSLGKLPLTEFVLYRRRGPTPGPMAPLVASFITRKDQLA